MISDLEKQKTVSQFCSYCNRTLVNARKDIQRQRSRDARRERLFCDMCESELVRLYSRQVERDEEVMFVVCGLAIGVIGEELVDALRVLDEKERNIVLLSYFAGWSDRRIATSIGHSRSTVQFWRTRAIAKLRELLEEGDDDA